MNTDTRSRSAAAPAESGVADLVDELIRRLQAGEVVNPDEIAGGDPGRADQVRQLLPTLERLAELGGSSGTGPGQERTTSAGPGLGVLGDYHLLREVGRGGMGIVYEAVQLSLHRRVALKVLPFAAVTDPRQLQRFQLEAQAAAQLHHTNIVPVYAVGCERGVHYYAMQFIEGDTLARVIEELRQHDAPGGGPGAKGGPASELAASLASGRLASDGVGQAADTLTAPHVPAAPGGPAPDPTPPSPTRAGSTLARGRAFFRNVAQLGIQAAEA